MTFCLMHWATKVQEGQYFCFSCSMVSSVIWTIYPIRREKPTRSITVLSQPKRINTSCYFYRWRKWISSLAISLHHQGNPLNMGSHWRGLTLNPSDDLNDVPLFDFKNVSRSQQETHKPEQALSSIICYPASFLFISLI